MVDWLGKRSSGPEPGWSVEIKAYQRGISATVLTAHLQTLDMAHGMQCACWGTRLGKNFYPVFHIGICQDADKIIDRKTLGKLEVLSGCKSLLIVMITEKFHLAGLFQG